MAPHFLCCLPIRLGAFFVALIELVISGIVAALMWTALYLNSQDKLSPSLSSSQKIASIIFGVTYTILFVASAFGLIGVLRKKISWIQQFLSFLRGYLIGNTIVTIVNIIIFFVDNKDSGSCVIRDSNGNCQDTSLSRGAQIAIVIVVAIVPLLILAYACWILSDCVKYLIDKQVYPMTYYPFSTGGYAAVGAKEETVSLTHNGGSATGAPYASGGV